MIYIAFFAFVVLVSAGIGALIVHLTGTRRAQRRQLVAEIDAAGAPSRPRRILVARAVDVTRPGLEPLPAMPPGWHDDSLGLVRQQAYATRDPDVPPWLETAANTGDLHWVRQQLDLDDFALKLEQDFYELLERVQADFAAIRVTA